MIMWKNVNVNKQNIKAETDRAVLIAMPHSSDYDGYCFWHSNKLIRKGRHSNSISISYNDDFMFTLIKCQKGNSRNIIDKGVINVAEFEEAFKIMNENIIAPTILNEYETHKPDKINAVKIETLDELKDE